MFLLIIIFLGIITSYTDITERKIRNIHIVLALILGLCAYVFSILNKHVSPGITAAINLAVGFTISYLLYYSDVWSAGDAKLFFVYTLLLPVSKYSDIFGMPVIVLFASIFLAATIGILLIESVNMIIYGKYRHNVGGGLAHIVFGFVVSLILIFSVGWIIPYIFQPFSKNLPIIVHVIFLFVLYLFVSKLLRTFRRKWMIWVILIIGLLLRIVMQPEFFHYYAFMKYTQHMIIYAIFFSILKIIFSMSGNNKGTVPFAPFMFIGALLANTDFLYQTMNILHILQK